MNKFIFLTLIFLNALYSDVKAENVDPCLSVSGGYLDDQPNHKPNPNLKKKAKSPIIIPYTIQYSELLAKSQPPSCDTYQLVSHSATYKVSLQSTEDENIKGVTGFIKVKIFENAGGWALEQQNNITVEYHHGLPENMKTTILSWEKSDGKVYRFFMRRIFNGEEVDIFRGDAKIDEDGIGYVSYQIPQSIIVKLPKGTLFPLGYLMNSLQASIEGKSVFNGTLFNGSSEVLEPQEINCFLGPSQLPRMSFSDPEVYSSKKVWPLVMAFYSLNSDSLEPEYELVYNILSRGIIRDMTVNYGTFTIKAVISNLKIFSDCV